MKHPAAILMLCLLSGCDLPGDIPNGWATILAAIVPTILFLVQRRLDEKRRTSDEQRREREREADKAAEIQRRTIEQQSEAIRTIIRRLSLAHDAALTYHRIAARTDLSNQSVADELRDQAIDLLESARAELRAWEIWLPVKIEQKFRRALNSTHRGVHRREDNSERFQAHYRDALRNCRIFLGLPPTLSEVEDADIEGDAPPSPPASGANRTLPPADRSATVPTTPTASEPASRT